MHTEATYCVYMVKTSRGNYYTGIAVDLNRRVHEHNHTKRGAKSLRGQRPVILVWQSETSLSKGMALKIERKLKSLSHDDKEKFLHNKLTLTVEEKLIACSSIQKTSSS